jgi:hypothetical protein
VFLDADDELLPGAVGSGVDALQAAPGLTCIARRCEVMDRHRRPVATRYGPVPTGDLYGQLLHHNFVWTPGAAVFRRAPLAAIGGFPADVAPAADYAVYLTLARHDAIGYGPASAVRYRQHDGNMSRDPVLMLNATLEVLRRERRHASRPARDFVAAERSWRTYYGEHIIERLRRDWRDSVFSAWQRAAIWTLLTKCPRTLAVHTLRKGLRVGRGLSRAPIEPGRFEFEQPMAEPGQLPPG